MTDLVQRLRERLSFWRLKRDPEATFTLNFTAAQELDELLNASAAEIDRLRRENAWQLTEIKDVRAGECGWAGCGDCDPEFRCYSGRERCIRLPPQAQGEPVMWMIVHPGCVTGLTESAYETALQKATKCPPGTAVVPLYARPDAGKGEAG